MLRKEDVAAMRMDYKMPVGFDEAGLVAREPFTQFDAWFREATKEYNIGEANAMVLSTCGRLVLSFAPRYQRRSSSYIIHFRPYCITLAIVVSAMLDF